MYKLFYANVPRLDPSGRGQGVCELIDVPLSEMDLYSSPHSHDENLLYHPDYDYYERDRNTCRPSACVDCHKPYAPPSDDHFRPTTYRPIYPVPDQHAPPNRYRPSSPPDTSIDLYRPSGYDGRPSAYDHGGRPPLGYGGYDNKPPDYDRYDVSGPPSSGNFRPPSGPSYGSEVDRYDTYKPIEISRPGYQEVILTSAHGYDQPPKNYHSKPFKDHYGRPDFIPIESYRPQYYRPASSSSADNSYLGPYRPPEFEGRPQRPDRFPPVGSSSIYLDRDPPPQQPSAHHQSTHYRKSPYAPYSIGEDKSWGSYGGSYGGSSYSKYSSNYWGLENEIKRKDGPHFNYFELGGMPNGGQHGDNSVWSYPGSRYDSVGGGGGGAGAGGGGDSHSFMDKIHYGSLGNLWTRRPGQDG